MSGVGAEKICRITKTFKMQEQKVFMFNKQHPNEVGTKAVYSQEPVFSSFLKKGKKLTAMDNAAPIPKSNKVQASKKKDVEKLMAFFAIPDDAAAEFYKDVAAASNASQGPDVEADLYDDEETFL